MTIEQTQEEIRLAEVQSHQAHWRRWGPYLSDRQWGTVGGNAEFGQNSTLRLKASD